METSKQRCTFCNKRLKMIVFDCKCNGVFCGKHRYTSVHNCPSLKIKQLECKEELIKNNPLIIHNKLEKI
jgi:predicted nucleic acid binding AN1-type Zn finger protein